MSNNVAAMIKSGLEEIAPAMEKILLLQQYKLAKLLPSQST